MTDFVLFFLFFNFLFQCMKDFDFFFSYLFNISGLFVLLQMLKISTANVILVSYPDFRFELFF